MSAPPYTVVVADDAPDLRMLLVRALSRDDRLKVVADVPDGAAAVDAVRAHHPDAVLMDVSMPVMDGLAATRAVKKERPDVVVVVFTGYGDERVAREAEAIGADAFRDKSTPLRDLADCIVELAEARTVGSRPT